MYDLNTELPSAKFQEIWKQQRRSVSRWKPSEQNFENFTVRGCFSKKTQKFRRWKRWQLLN